MTGRIELRGFLAHPKDIEDEERLTRLTLLATVAMENAIAKWQGTRVPRIITGREDFNAHVMQTGGWDGWAHSVAVGTEFRDGEIRPRYDLIILTPGPLFGKATASIIDTALTGQKPVFFMPGDDDDADCGLLYPVTQVIQKDARDFKKGWTVRYGASV